MSLFKKLASDGALGGAVLINTGRGGLQVETDILAALDRSVLVGASLDVFESEPLDRESPLWTRPEIVITPMPRRRQRRMRSCLLFYVRSPHSKLVPRSETSSTEINFIEPIQPPSKCKAADGCRSAVPWCDPFNSLGE